MTRSLSARASTSKAATPKVPATKNPAAPAKPAAPAAARAPGKALAKKPTAAAAPAPNPPVPTPHPAATGKDAADDFMAWAERTLRAMREETLAALRGIADADFANQPSADQLDAASQQEEREAFVRRGERLKARLADITKTLRKIEEGEYGLCEVSGEEIPEERLRANPLACYTVEVQERLEHRQRQGL